MAKDKLSMLGSELVTAMEEVRGHLRGEVELPSRVARVPETVDVLSIRRKMGLTQRQFADRFGFSVGAVRDWEQGRRQPERAARVLLLIIDRETKAVERALAAG